MALSILFSSYVSIYVLETAPDVYGEARKGTDFSRLAAILN